MSNLLYVRLSILFCFSMGACLNWGCNYNSERMKTDVSIINGDTISVVTHYNSKGDKEAVVFYKNSVMHGFSQIYFQNGVLKQEKSFYNNKEFGSFIQYSHNGMVFRYSFLIDSVHSSYDRYYDTSTGKLLKVEGDPLACYKIESKGYNDSLGIRLFFSTYGSKNIDVKVSVDGNGYQGLYISDNKELPFIKTGVIKVIKKPGTWYRYLVRMNFIDKDENNIFYSDSISFRVLK